MQDRRCSIWHLVSGIIMLVLGIIVWANPLSSLYAMAIYLGAVVFLLGCGYITFSFTEYSGWYFVVGLLDLFIGLILLTNLGLTVQTLPILFAFWFLATGVMQISGSIEIRKTGLPWGWSMFSGILGVILSFFILAYQSFGEFALVLTVGFYIFAFGVLSIAEYFYFRKFCKLVSQA
ncbi:MAG: DUF308 domain-containing protein [Pseudomonadota bacterium]|nr:DUF308 domain-containing protein [Pseudomonadota bacterium]